MQPCHHCAKRNVPEACRFPESSAPRPATAISLPPHAAHHHPYFSPPSDTEKKRRLSDDPHLTPKPVLLPPITPIAMGRTASMHSVHSVHSAHSLQSLSQMSSGRSVPTLSPMPAASPDRGGDDDMRPSPGYRAYRPWSRPHLPTPGGSFDGHGPPAPYRRDQYFAVQQPLSSERHEIRTPPPAPDTRRASDGSDSSGNWRPPPPQGPQADGDVLMQEGGAQGFGSLAHEGAGEEHSRAYPSPVSLRGA